MLPGCGSIGFILNFILNFGGFHSKTIKALLLKCLNDVNCKKGNFRQKLRNINYITRSAKKLYRSFIDQKVYSRLDLATPEKFLK